MEFLCMNHKKVNQHVQQVDKEANRCRQLLWRLRGFSFLLYKVLLGPYLQYCTFGFSKNGYSSIECCLKGIYKSNLKDEGKLDSLGLYLLEVRRMRDNHIQIYQILRGLNRAHVVVFQVRCKRAQLQ